MGAYSDLASKPVFFERNRVFRVYLGGKQLSKYGGKDEKDSMFPEEWIASKVRAINPKYFGPRDGVSVVEGTDIFLDDLLKSESESMLGGRKYDCLVKFLDSAIRLPVQVHPTPEFSKKHFNSSYGKTEAWLVLETRSDDARLYFGFKDKIDKQTLWKLEERSLDEKDIMSTALAYVNVKPGDVYLIRAGMIHAIGAGCTILEVQEPTDFTIQPENWCGDYKISENEKYIGLTKSEALDCFDFQMYGDRAAKLARMLPKTDIERDGYKKETLISYDDTPCFSLVRHTVSGTASFALENAPSVWVILEGCGTLSGEGYSKSVEKGDYFFLPYAAAGGFVLSGGLTAAECLPSLQ